MRYLLAMSLCGALASPGSAATAAAMQLPSAANAPNPSTAKLHVVLLKPGPAYVKSLPATAQKGFAEHASGMMQLAKAGTLIVGGPLLEDFAAGEFRGALLIVRAETAAIARAIVAKDPLAVSGVVEVDRAFAFRS